MVDVDVDVDEERWKERDEYERGGEKRKEKDLRVSSCVMML